MDYILTNEGAALMTRAVSGKNLIFTRAESGNGYTSSPATLTQVIGMQQALDMSVMHEGSDLKITCFMTNRELDEGYILKQLGIYAKLAEMEEDILVAIGQQYSGEQIYPFADGEAEYEFVILMKVSGTSSITVESGAGNLATKRELNSHVNRMDNPHGVTKKDIGLDKVQNLAVDDMAPSFTEAEERENINSGEKNKILWGKVRKWLSDLKSAAFAAIANNCTTTEAGTVLDGRVGKILQDEIEELREADSEINSNIANLKKSVADGKSAIASAITSKGVSTTADAAFSVMAGNIRSIKNASQIGNKGSNFQVGDSSSSGSWQQKSASYNVGVGVHIFWVCCSRADGISVSIPTSHETLNMYGNTGTSFNGFAATYKVTVLSGSVTLSFSARIIAGKGNSNMPGAFASAVVGV